GLVGTSSGAALGAVIVFYFSLGGPSGIFVPFGGMAGALLALVLLYALTGRDSNIMTLILAGVAINSFAGAMTSLALNLAPSPFAALEIVFWMLGSLADRSMLHVQMALPLTLAGWALLLSTGRPLDALTLGEDTAASLGYNRTWVRARVIGGTGLAVGAAVSVTGVIGFVGLVVPHLLRPLVGHRPSRLLIPSAFAGALLTLVADMGVRLMPFGPELKLGVVTSIIGAPFFLYLLLRSRRAQL
ncbi:MAG TPA: iron ABC transporter permease, partial [Alphaproteobacteria bacterium]|nr:iron ABC transporter permease [Alphaproteobacteria bacterium]